MRLVSRLFLSAAGLVSLPIQRVAIAADAAEFAETDVAADLVMLRANAERGDALAQYNLGTAFAEGRQTPVNPVEALAWLTLASEQGSTARELGTLLISLSAEQIAAAGRRLAAIRAGNPNLRSTPVVGTAMDSPAGNTQDSVTGTPTAPAGPRAADADTRPRGFVALEIGLPSAGDELSAAKPARSIASFPTPAEESRGQVSAQGDSELKLLRTQVYGLERDLRSATAALKRVAADKAAAETTLAAANQQLAGAMKELKSSRRQDADSSRTLSASAEQKISDLQFDLSDTRARLTGVEEQFAARDEELRGLRTAVAKADSRARLATSEVELARRARDETQRRLAGMTQELAEARKQVAAARELKSRIGQFEAERTTRPVESGISKEEFDRVTAAQVEVEHKLSVALRSYTLMTRERDELRAQVSTARELELRLHQLEAGKASLPEGDSYVSKGEYARVVAAQAEAEDKLSTALRAFALQVKERDELRARNADLSKNVFNRDRDEPVAQR